MRTLKRVKTRLGLNLGLLVALLAFILCAVPILLLSHAAGKLPAQNLEAFPPQGVTERKRDLPGAGL